MTSVIDHLERTLSHMYSTVQKGFHLQVSVYPFQFSFLVKKAK